MQFKTFALAGVMMFVAGAALADDPMANTYANTITTKDAASGQTAVDSARVRRPVHGRRHVCRRADADL